MKTNQEMCLNCGHLKDAHKALSGYCYLSTEDKSCYCPSFFRPAPKKECVHDPLMKTNTPFGLFCPSCPAPQGKKEEKCSCGEPHTSDFVIHCYPPKNCYLKPKVEPGSPENNRVGISGKKDARTHETVSTSSHAPSGEKKIKISPETFKGLSYKVNVELEPTPSPQETSGWEENVKQFLIEYASCVEPSERNDTIYNFVCEIEEALSSKDKECEQKVKEAYERGYSAQYTEEQKEYCRKLALADFVARAKKKLERMENKIEMREIDGIRYAEGWENCRAYIPRLLDELMNQEK